METVAFILIKKIIVINYVLHLVMIKTGLHLQKF